jgi:hypothetical protein
VWCCDRNVTINILLSRLNSYEVRSNEIYFFVFQHKIFAQIPQTSAFKLSYVNVSEIKLYINTNILNALQQMKVLLFDKHYLLLFMYERRIKVQLSLN